MIKEKEAAKVANHQLVLLKGPDGKPVRKVHYIDRDIESIIAKDIFGNIVRLRPTDHVFLVIRKKKK